MSVQAIITAAVVVGAIGLIVGLLLGVAGVVFNVEVDEREIKVRECLPGNNCGGCGYAGCDGLAGAIAKGEAPVSGCPVGGAAVANAIAEIMGVEAGVIDKKVAFVKCAGTCRDTELKYNYNGIQDCRKLALLPGSGAKSCDYGCLGFGSCAKVCDNNAITIQEGIAKVDKDKCISCGKCVAVCPRNLIEIIPYSASFAVQCSSNDKGKQVKAVCKAGCIGCSLCVRQCENGAITVENNVAKIDYSKCTGCGKCAEKCPSKIIRMTNC